MKKCRECKKDLIIGTNITKAVMETLNYICKNCNTIKAREYRKANPQKYLKNQLSTYNLSVDSYNILLEAQNHVCAICEKPPGVNPRQTRLCVDHCHISGKVRFLLCDQCNRALGMLGDTKKSIMKVIKYLERPDARELI